MNARTLGWFAAIAFVVLVLMLVCQGIMLHLRALHPMTHIDYFLANAAGRATPSAYFRDTAVADVAIFLHSPMLITIWLVTSVLLWGILIAPRSPGPER